MYGSAGIPWSSVAVEGCILVILRLLYTAGRPEGNKITSVLTYMHLLESRSP